MFGAISQLGKAGLHVTLLRERIEKGKRWIIPPSAHAPQDLPRKQTPTTARHYTGKVLGEGNVIEYGH